ncbi:transposase [Rhizobium sp. BK313]|nr:transposase [Rhizobium sp. BK313]
MLSAYPRTIVLADKVYDADRIRELIQEQSVTPNIPRKSNRRWKPCFSNGLYRERNLIERFFSKLKHFRRVRRQLPRRGPARLVVAVATRLRVTA